VYASVVEGEADQHTGMEEEVSGKAQRGRISARGRRAVVAVAVAVAGDAEVDVGLEYSSSLASDRWHREMSCVVSVVRRAPSAVFRSSSDNAGAPDSHRRRAQDRRRSFCRDGGGVSEN